MTDVLPSPDAELYQAKRRSATKAEVERRREGLLTIIRAMWPMTRTAGLLSGDGSWPRRENRTATPRCSGLGNHAQVRTASLSLADRQYPLAALAALFNGVEEALEQTARLYRKNLWAEADRRI
jgi:hypothetical protein